MLNSLYKLLRYEGHFLSSCEQTLVASSGPRASLYQMPSISEVDPAVTHAVKNLQSLSQERWENLLYNKHAAIGS
jgi:hypothetical protein